jgi:hypothetical protein
MKQNIGFCQFTDAFRDMGRKEQFSYDGLKALFEYIEMLDDDTGQETELDVISLCCEFSEYESALEIAEEYGNDSEDEDNALEWLLDNTLVIGYEGGIIIQSF